LDAALTAAMVMGQGRCVTPSKITTPSPGKPSSIKKPSTGVHSDANNPNDAPSFKPSGAKGAIGARFVNRASKDQLVITRIFV
jgi:hypothetical protein